VGRYKSIFDADRDQFQKIVTAQAAGRNLSAALLLKSDGSAIENVGATLDKKIVLPTPDLLAEVTETDPRVALIPEDNHLAAVVKLRGYDNTYLYGARLLDPRVVQQLRATQERVGDFAILEASRRGLQLD